MRIDSHLSETQPGGAPMTTEPLVRVIAQQRRSQATFDAILDAAGSLFDEVGIEATTMDAIPRAVVEVSIGTVYRFFENRDAIVAHSPPTRWRERIQEAALPGVQRREPATETQHAVITDFLAAFRQLLDQLPGTRGLLVAVAPPRRRSRRRFSGPPCWIASSEATPPDSDQHAGAKPRRPTRGSPSHS